MNMEEKLRAVVETATSDGLLWHQIIHGNNTLEVQTENGFVPSLSKQMKDVRDSITGGVLDVVSAAENARDLALEYKNSTQTLKSETLDLRNEAEGFKNQSQTTFNNISTATNSSIESIELSGTNQITLVQNTGLSEVNKVQSAGSEQVTLATKQAEKALGYAQNAAPTPLGTKLTVAGSTKVPDGYEPVWYKNTITRARYPDFFTELVDTDSLILVDETTYDNQVATYKMCGSYVLKDNNTLILPLLKNFGRSGIPEQLGNLELDQFQGHYHSNQIRIDDYGSGDGATVSYTNGYDEGMRDGEDDIITLNPKTGTNGEVRFGDETRPKSYYELTYIKCADVSKSISQEETSEIRNTFLSKADVSLNNIESYTLQNKLFTVYKNGQNWYQKRNADGFIIQSGIMPITASNITDYQCNLITPFSDTNYGVFLTAETYQCHWDVHVTNHYWAKTTTSFHTCNHVAFTTGLRWIAFGY